MKKLIDAKKLYEQTAEWEAQALEQVDKYDPVDSRDEWLRWSYILKERGAFKHDVMDAPVVDISSLWISCDERLPEYGVTVLVDSDCGIMIGYLDTSELWFGLRPFMDSIELDVDAWMPLPKSYNREED